MKKRSWNIGVRPAVIGGLLVILLIAGGVLVHHFNLTGLLKDYLTSHVPPALFLVLMAILPILGAPIAVFLVLVGMKFGVGAGILLSAVLMAFHMAVTYFLVNFLLADRIARMLQYFKVSTPTLLRNYTTWQAVIFMLVPGVPYAIKNHLLALAGYRFAPYMAINWSTQYGHGIPLIIMGGAVMEMNLAILGIALLLLLIFSLVQQYLRKKFSAKGGGRDLE